MVEMRNSGIEWLGDIPDNWDIHPLYYYFTERKNKNYALSENNLLSLSYGKIIRKDINTNGGLLPASFNTYNIVEPGDIIIRPTDLQNDKRSLRTGYVKEHGIITSAYIDLQPKKDVNSRYFHYLLHAYDVMKVFYNMGNGVRQGLNFSEFSKLLVIAPPGDIQSKIVAALDEKCENIDMLVVDLQKQIDALEEYKQAVIVDAVTNGLDKKINKTDSGVEWIGTIPEHWAVTPFQYVLKERNEKNYPERTDERLSLSIDKGITLYADKTTNLDRFKEDVTQYKLAYKGDFVMNSMNMIVGAVGISSYFGCVSPAYYVFFDNDGYTARFCDYIFHTKSMLRVLFSMGKGIMAIVRGDDRVNTCRLKVSRYDLNKLLIPMPPSNERKEIVEYLDEKVTNINEAIRIKKEQVEVLEEYKKSIVFEYVSGKRTVR